MCVDPVNCSGHCAECQDRQRRRKAWRTRRERYGPEGHSRYAYARRTANASCGYTQRCCRLLDLVLRLHREGVLSEGQVAQASGLDRVTIRAMADNGDT